MLSRVAEACFWMARYVERAENVARILDVNYHALIENATPAAAETWWAVVATTGDAAAFFARYPEPAERSVAEFLLLDRQNRNSVVSCITSARENARRIRDRISSETWEELNRIYHAVNRASFDIVMMDGPYSFCRGVKNGSHLLAGVIDHTMAHDEGWHFVRAGRALERAGMIARILDSQAALLETPAATGDFIALHRWIAVLKSASAYEAFRKTWGASMAPERIVSFLLQCAEFPRSAIANVQEVEEALLAIRTHLRLPGVGAAGREAGALVARLQYTEIERMPLTQLHQFLDEFELACNQIGDAITTEFFTTRMPLRRGA